MGPLTELFISTAFVASTMRLAVPLMLAATGEVISERAGILNVGLEGMMLTGAFTAALASDVTGNPWLGAVAGALGGAALASVHGAIVINWGGDQVVSGLALNLGALGLTTFLSRRILGTDQSEVAGLGPVDIPVLSDLPFFGPVFFAQSPFFYFAIAAGAALGWFLFRSRPGLAWRSAGEDPDALDSVGQSVMRTRWTALLVCGALAGIGGASISLAQLFSFIENMTGGRGFIALALVIVTRWRPMWAVGVAIFFASADALALRIQALDVVSVPHQISLMLPLALTLVVYGFAARAGRPPAALGRHWLKS